MTRRIACLTIDVEADHHDLVRNTCYEALEHEPTWRWLAEFSHRRGVPWTAFVVGQLLESRSGLAQRLAATGWELGLHSYSHDPRRADALDEIRRGKAAFRSAFGYDPTGYRAPLGKITPEGLDRLLAEGFHYDASVFPAWRPGTFNHRNLSLDPSIRPGNRRDVADEALPLVELPCAVVPHARLIVSVSYLKLLGLPIYAPLLRWFGLPAVAVIDCHLHDLAPAPEAYRQLPPFWKAVYRRNRGRGPALLEWLVEWLARAGYEFCRMEDVARMVRERAGYA